MARASPILRTAEATALSSPAFAFDSFSSSDDDDGDDATRMGMPHDPMNSTSPSLAPATFLTASARSFPTSASSSDIAAAVVGSRPDATAASLVCRSGGIAMGRNSMSSTGLRRMGFGSISTNAASMVARDGPAVRPTPTLRVMVPTEMRAGVARL